MADIIKKLQINNYKNKLILNKPDTIQEFKELEFDKQMKKTTYGLVFAFIFSLDEFVELLETAIDKNLLNPEGYLYFAYPKKGNKSYKEYIGRDDFFKRVETDEEGYVLKSSLKFAKMVAFDDVFTVIGLKHQAKRKSKSSQPSQCVADYVDRIPDLQKHFEKKQKILMLYNSLAPGYQRDWARYVYSAQTTTTLTKRLVKMEDILKQGFKSKDLYKQKKK